MRLKHKVVLITGGGTGIGRTMAHLFAREGATIVAAQRSAEAGNTLIADLRQMGSEAIAVPTDVSLARDVERVIRLAEEHYGALHVLVNNAGIAPEEDHSVTDTSEAVWDIVMNVNLKGVFLCCKYGVPALLRSGGGSIINVASLAAVLGSAIPQIAYVASKGGVISLTREIAVTYARQGIRANTLCPGPIETPMFEHIRTDTARLHRRMNHIPAGRFGKPVETAEVALFLASDEASYVDGATIMVDGGISAAYVTAD